MFKEKINLGLVLTLFIAIWGCGTMAKDDDVLYVPQKVSIEMPKALKAESSQNQKQLKLQKEDSKKSLGYLELKEDVTFLEKQRINIEINLLFINEVTIEIEQYCKGILIEETCIIDEDTLTFLFDKKLLKKIRLLSSEDFSYLLGYTFTFGKIEFIEHNNSNTYGYSLKMDTSFTDESTTSFQRISWSKDEKLIFSKYTEENAEVKKSIKINFSINNDNSRKIVVDDGFFNKIDGSSDTFHLDMLKKSDKLESYELNSTSLAIDSDAQENTFASIGRLSNLGGYLNFTGTFENETFKENDTFDAEGKLLSSSYCYSGMTCDLEDDSTW